MDSQEFIPRSRSSSRVLGHQCLCDDGNCLGFHCPCYNQQNEICYNHSCCLFCVKLKNETLQMKLPKEREEEKKYREGKLACNCVELRKKTGDKNIICKCSQNYPRLFGSQKLSKHQKNVKVKAHQPTKINKIISVGCSCKKSHCLKKYCHCFAMNNKCSPQCECEDCQNDFDDRQVQDQICNDKVQYSNGDDSIQSESSQEHVDIDQYFEQKSYENLMMPKSMEFDHPDLKNAYHV